VTAVSSTEVGSVDGLRGREPALDGLRALAALAVVLTHVAFQTGLVGRGALGVVLGRFDFGVTVFFALSGYLLYGSHVRAAAAGRTAPDTVGYYVRRAVRVLPAYWLVLVVVLVTTRPPLPDAVANLALVQIYLPGVFLPGYTHTWSLVTELSFYAVLPLIAIALRRTRRPTVVLVAMVLTGWASAGLSGLVQFDAGSLQFAGENLAARWLPAHLAWFAVGMLLAQMTTERQTPWVRQVIALAQRPGTCLAVAGAAFVLATTNLAGPLTLAPTSGPQAALKELLGTVVAAFLLLPLVLGRGDDLWSAAMGSRLARRLGLISYGIFLWHLPVLEGFYVVSGVPRFSGNLVLALIAVLPMTVLLASLTYVLVERPLIRRAARFRVRAAEPG